ncbi:ATP-binding protein [Pedosphaera parvula]|uniref:histidine kinase n=1 Tax=Pedosphaera parvula (strain Ellin514) TaxID=320771 RepID=B9XK45_PEDPL|nr:ATP-binding protein [Pedosphaera parvula]EEF59868.1 integral membrane sensor hybrid histidine kinase [Pedosphaera parvula Ellin514]
MSIPSLKAQISFQAKVLVPVVTVMVLLIAITTWIVNHHITTQLHTQTAMQLDTAGKVFTNTQVILATNLLSRYRNVVKEPRVKAVVARISSQDSAALKTLNVLLDDLIREDGDAKIAICTTQDGKRYGGASVYPKLGLSEFEAASRAVIQRALDGGAAVETIRVGGTFFDVVSIPAKGAGDAVGAITFGIEIGNTLALQVEQLTGSKIVFLAEDQIVASSLTKSELSPSMVAKFKQLSNDTDEAGSSAKEIAINNEHYLCRVGHFGSINGGGKLGYILLSSYEQSLATLQSTQSLLMFVSLVGILVGILAVWLCIRTVTKPLRQLRASAEAVGRGDFSKHVEVTSKDEYGELAAVFNQMIENVKTSREQLEKTVETLKATQNQLIQSEKLSGIGEFVAGVAHELNNPLTSVMGFAEILQQSELPEQHRRFLDMIFKSAKRCQKIVAGLLSFARKHLPERKVLSVNTVLESAIEIVQYQLRTSNIEVITALDPNLPPTLVDQHQMQQVFLNIINNARQAMEVRQTRGRICITSQVVDDRVRVIFQDNGPGISADNLKKLFVPFFTTKEVGKGTGLGLSICYGIVTEHGGTITPQSKHGEGASFTIDLPITRDFAAKPEAVAVLPQTQPTKEGLGKRVLVVDDEDSILQMIKEALTLNGYQVDVARDGETALSCMANCRYDLALCDWKMPGLNGQEVYEKLREKNPEMSRRLIFITGDVVNEKAQEYLKSRDKICLSKPFTLAEFRAAITRVLTAA